MSNGETAPSNLNAPSPRREFDIDWFRGYVCLCLITYHFYYNSPLTAKFHELVGSIGDFLVHHIRLGVESFFILAGFMMAHMLRPAPGETVSVKGYLVRRFFRLILPYWVAVLLATADRWGVALVFKGGDSTGLPGAREVFAQMFLINEFFSVRVPDFLVGVMGGGGIAAHEFLIPRIPDASVGYWSMVSLEQFYLLWLGSYFLCRLLLGSGDGGYGLAEKIMSWLTLAACIASAFVVASQEETRFLLPRYAMYLTLGLMLYWAVRQKFARTQFIIGVLTLATVAVYTGTSRTLAALIAVGILVTLCRGYRMPTNWITRALAFCGRRSYSLYLMHPIVGIRVLSLGKVAAGYGPIGLIGLVIAAYVATFLIAELFYRYVELPCQARARKVDYRRRSRAVDAQPRSSS